MDDRELLNVVMGIVGKEKCLDDCAEIPCGEYSRLVTGMRTRASFIGPGITSKGTILRSFSTSSKRLPINRFIEKTVFSGLMTAWRLAV